MAALTAEQRQAVFNLVHAYADFWKSYSGPRGREAPSFSFFDIRGLLERAAEIVVRIRIAQEESSRPHTTPASIDGSAHEYLFSIKRHPKQFPDRFVRNLVHATLRLGTGYADGMTPAAIDAQIEKYDPALKSETTDTQAQAALRAQYGALAAAWGHTCMAIGEILGHGVDSFVSHHTRWDVPKLQRLVSDLHNATHNADTLFGTHGKQGAARNQRKHKHKKSAGASATVAAARERAGSAEPDSTATEHSEHPPAVSDAGDAHSEGPEHSEDELPPTRDMPSFVLPVQRVEEDIAAIEERLATFSSAIDEESEALAAEPETGRAIVASLLERCLGFAEMLARDSAVIRGLHLRPDLETREMAHLQEATAAVAALSHRLAALGNSLDSLSEEHAQSDTADTPSGIRVTSGEGVPASTSSGLESDLTQMSEWFRALKLEPRVDVLEQDESIVLQMFLPDMRQEDVDVLIGNDRVLVIRGFRRPSPQALLALVRRAPKPLRKASLLQLGTGQFGSFVEFFRIPDAINLAAIEGGYEHGLLRVVLPKATSSHPSAAHGLLQHPLADRPAPRRTLYAPHAPGRPLVTADPRTLGMFDARRRAPAPPNDDDDEEDFKLPTEQDFEREVASASRPAPSSGASAGAGAGGPIVRFVDPATGAVFEMPLAALQASAARATAARRAQQAGGRSGPAPHL